ncbi:adenosine deaminase AGSA [Biomphalaria pfeifferi]|uniref:Adenosine deaminase AGSA n=1 Tax=Biomphalaria pfeifferi TaxID=112525 RepID=A0AAD8B7R0_BIOPF|nr:adenosine deaminase AGSA [Biomphalaria pfeifferi]
MTAFYESYLPSFDFSKSIQSNYLIEKDEPDRIPLPNFKPETFTTEFVTQPNHYVKAIETDSTVNSGAIPKSKHSSCKTKNVSWSSELTTLMPTVNIAEECHQLIQAIRKESDFTQKPSLQAVKWGVDDSYNTDCTSLTTNIELIAILLHIKLQRFPTVEEIMDMIENNVELNEDNLIHSILKLCQSSGISALKSILASFHNADSPQDHTSPDSTQDHTFPDSTQDHTFPDSTQDHTSLPAVSVNLESDSCVQDSSTVNFAPEMLIQDDVNISQENQHTISPEDHKNILKLHALKREQNYLKNSLTCLICKDRPIDTMLLPCGHVVLCSVCSESCYSCPVCKKTALAEVKTYLS